MQRICCAHAHVPLVAGYRSRDPVMPIRLAGVIVLAHYVAVADACSAVAYYFDMFAIASSRTNDRPSFDVVNYFNSIWSQ